MSETVTVELSAEQIAELRGTGRELQEEVHRAVRLYLALENGQSLLAEAEAEGWA